MNTPLMNKTSSTPRRATLAAIVLFALLAAALLHKSLLPGYTLLPLDVIQHIAPWDHLELGPTANRLLTDPFLSFYPRRHWLTQSLRAGQLPLWNPHVLTGTPTIANPNFQTFYPPNLLAALFLLPRDALPWLAWFHLTLTATLTYLFLRRHRLHWLACVLGSGVWMLNGYGLVWLENPHRLSTAAWLPGLFWAYEAATQEKKVSWAALGGIFLGLAVLGGQMQFIFVAGIMLGLYALVTTILQARGAGRWSTRPLLTLVLIGVIGLAIGAITLLPAAEFATMSQRRRLTADTIQNTGWPLTHLVTLVAPNFYGNPATPVRYWGAFNYAEMTAYFGVVALLLALAAPLLARRSSFLTRALVLAVATLSITLGTPLARLLFLLPGAQFVVLERTLFLIPLMGAWLAAAALDGWLAANYPWRRQFPAILLALVTMALVTLWTVAALGDAFTAHRMDILPAVGRGAALALVAGLLLLSRWPRVAGSLLVLLALADLWQWGYRFNPVISVDYLYPANAVVDTLRQDSGLYRVLPLQSEGVIFGPNVLSVYGVQTPGGYTPLIKSDYQELIAAMDDDIEVSWMANNDNMVVMSHFHPMISLLNVKYVLSSQELPFTEVGQVFSEGCETTAAVTEAPLTQPFAIKEPGLNRVDTLFADVAAPATAVLDFWLWRGEAGGEPVVHIPLTAGALSANRHHSFSFTPVPDSAAQTFVWGLSSQEEGITLCRTADGAFSFSAYVKWLQKKEVADGVWIYENPNVLPRAFLVRHVQVRRKEEVIAALHAPDFNYYHSAVLTTPLPSQQQSQLATEPVRNRGQATIREYGLHRVEIGVETAESAFLVLSDAYYPGWEATIDGNPTPIYETNHTLRGVFVPAGTHRVQFQFRPAILVAGAFLTALGVLLAIGLMGRELFRGDRQ